MNLPFIDTNFQKKVYETFNEKEALMFQMIVVNAGDIQWLTENLQTKFCYGITKKIMEYFNTKFKLLEPIDLDNDKILIQFDESTYKLKDEIII